MKPSIPRAFLLIIFTALSLDGGWCYAAMDLPSPHKKARLTTLCHFQAGTGANSVPREYSLNALDEDRDLLIVAKRIFEVSNLGSNFVVMSSADVDNAGAYLEIIQNPAGKLVSAPRYVVYNPTYINSRKRQMPWFPYLIFSHEIGHHAYFHTITSADSRYNELEADRFAGNIMNRLGISMDDLSTLIKGSVVDQRTDGSHPSLADRTKEFLLGWQQAEKEKKQPTQVASGQFKQDRNRAFQLGAESAFALGFCVQNLNKREISTEKVEQTLAAINTWLEDLRLSPRIAYPSGRCSKESDDIQLYALRVASSLRARDFRLQRAFELGWYGVNKYQTKGRFFGDVSLFSIAIQAGYDPPIEMRFTTERTYFLSILERERESLRQE